MFGRHATPARRADRIAGMAWDNLTAAVDAAGSSTRSAGKRAAGMLDDTSSRVGAKAKKTTKEARRRANAAYDALAGRRQRTPWGWLAAVGLAGAAIGWVATVFGRQLLPRDQTMDLPLMDEDFADTRS
jgi:hypothetical protein